MDIGVPCDALDRRVKLGLLILSITLWDTIEMWCVAIFISNVGWFLDHYDWSQHCKLQ